MAQTGLTPAPDQINICGYSPEEGEAAIRRIHARLGRLPSAILVNATISFEGVFRFLKVLPDAAFEHTALGCYDWDPFLSQLHFPVSMVRQNAKAMVEQAFGLLDSGDPGKAVRMIRPDLLFALMDDMGGFGQRSCSLHNPAAVIACTDPEVFKMDRLSIDEVETGEQVGRTGRSQNDAAPSIAVCVDGDIEAIRARFAAAFDRI